MGSRIVIEKIATEETLRKSATTEELSIVGQFGSASRRCEVLAWRAVVRRVLGDEVKISHDEYGAPVVDMPNTFIGVSHSRECVAVIFSDGECAIDIESADRDFRRVASHYLSEEELALAEQNDLYGEMWCAKEALYKYYKKGGFDFASDISIKEYDGDRAVLRATILDGEPIEVKIEREGNLIIAVID